MHIVPQVLHIRVLFLLLVSQQSLLLVLLLDLHLLLQLFLLLFSSFGCLDYHLFAALLVLEELLRDLWWGLVPLAHYEMIVYKLINVM